MLVASPSSQTASHDAFCWPVRVYYEDTDAGSVVYYANYLKFCERARTEWLRSMGLQQAQILAEQKRIFVVRSVQADYLRAAVLDDALLVVTRIEKMGRASIVFAQNVERDGQVLFEAKVVVACVDVERMKSAPIPDDVRALLASKMSQAEPGEPSL